MPAHFPVLKAQLALDIAAVLGSDCTIKFGKPRKKIAANSAVVRTSIVRGRDEDGLREVVEYYSFDILLFLPLPDPNVTDIEDLLFEKADALTMLLAPFSTSGVPVYAGPYAGVGTLQRVTEVTPQDDEDTDAFCSVLLTFTCQCHGVYQ